MIRIAEYSDRLQEDCYQVLNDQRWSEKELLGCVGPSFAEAVPRCPGSVGFGADVFCQLLVTAAMSGLVGLSAVTDANEVTTKRVGIVGHDIEKIQIFYNNNFDKSENKETGSLEFFDGGIAKVVPEVIVARGRFWDSVHFDVRTNFALMLRKFEAEGIKIRPLDGIITDKCRIASRILLENFRSKCDVARLKALMEGYMLPIEGGIFLLPTSGMSASLASHWSVKPGRYDPDPFETIMPVLFSSCVAVTLPSGVSAEGLPTGLTMAGSSEELDRLFLLARWYQKVNSLPEVS